MLSMVLVLPDSRFFVPFMMHFVSLRHGTPVRKKTKEYADEGCAIFGAIRPTYAKVFYGVYVRKMRVLKTDSRSGVNVITCI